ncbi:MAG: TetR/AcrR family transcriptional regulator [Brachybacterium sp.]|nr:TetR/AcrR family transcriptional regulator [Brachybacterium sp.]
MPKIIGGSLEEHRERTRTRIFGALGELMETEDFDALTFSRVAQAAGVGRTAMYNHFPDKDALLVEFAMHETTGYLEQLRDGIADATTTVEAVELYVRTQVSLRGAFHMPSRSASGGTLAPETARRMREHVVMIEDVLRQILLEGIRAGELAPDLDVDATVRIVNTLLIGRSTAADSELEALVVFVLRGLGAHT